MIAIEFGDSTFKSKFLTSYLKTLNQIGGACVQDTPATFDQRQSKRCRKVAFAAA
jgi:hypothetical protein